MDLSDNYLRGIYLVITSESDEKNAHKIANILLGEKLVPCVSFKNIESHFWWKDEINYVEEVQLIIKCNENKLNSVCRKISEIHSYEVPEIMYFPISTNKNYHRWVNSL